MSNYLKGQVANNIQSFSDRGIVKLEPQLEKNATLQSEWRQKFRHQPFPQNLKGLTQLLSEYDTKQGLQTPNFIPIEHVNDTNKTSGLLHHVMYKRRLANLLPTDSDTVQKLIGDATVQSNLFIDQLTHDYNLLSEDVDSFNALVVHDDYAKYRKKIEVLFETLTTSTKSQTFYTLLKNTVWTSAQFAAALTSAGISDAIISLLQPIAALELFRTSVDRLSKDTVWKERIAPHLRKIWDAEEVSFQTTDPNLTFLQKIFQDVDSRYKVYNQEYDELETLVATKRKGVDTPPTAFDAKQKVDKYETDDMKTPTRSSKQQERRKQVLFLFLYALFGPFNQSTSTDKFTAHSSIVANITYGIQQMQNRRTLEIAHRYNVQQIRLQLLEYTLFLKSLKENVAENAQNYLNENSLELYSYFDIMGADNGRVVSTEETANLFFGGRKSRKYKKVRRRTLRKRKLKKKVYSFYNKCEKL